MINFLFFFLLSLPLVYFQVMIERNQMYFLHLFEWPREQQNDHFFSPPSVLISLPGNSKQIPVQRPFVHLHPGWFSPMN